VAGWAFVVVGLVIGGLTGVVLIRLDPGPGPKKLASPEAWSAHEERVRKLRRPVSLGIAGAVALTSLLALLGGDASRLLAVMRAMRTATNPAAIPGALHPVQSDLAQGSFRNAGPGERQP
jgi:hypothetical protein